MANKKLTDNQLGTLYVNLFRLYNDSKSSETGLDVIIANMQGLTHWYLSEGYLKDLSDEEKQRVFRLTAAIIESLPNYEKKIPWNMQRKIQRESYAKYTPPTAINYYYTSQDPLLTWLVLSDLTRPRGFWYWLPTPGGSNHHGRGKEDGDPLAKLILLLLIGALLSSAIILTFFTIRELLDCSDRILASEGRYRALMSVSIMAASASLAGILGTLILSIPIAILASAAAMNPVTMLVVTGVALSLIGAGTAAVCLNQFRLNERFIRRYHQNALDPAEPERFSLSHKQAVKLEENEFDIDRVKLAMAAIRQAMNATKMDDKFSRLFYKQGKEQQRLLSLLREVKAGTLETVEVGDLCFALKAQGLDTIKDYDSEDDEGLVPRQH